MIELIIASALIAYLCYTAIYFIHTKSKWDDVFIYIAIVFAVVIVIGIEITA